MRHDVLRSALRFAALVVIGSIVSTSTASAQGEQPPTQSPAPAADASAGSQPPPLAKEFILPSPAWSVHLSPGGESLLWLSKTDGVDEIGVRSLKDGKVKTYAIGAYLMEYLSGTNVVRVRNPVVPATSITLSQETPSSGGGAGGLSSIGVPYEGRPSVLVRPVYGTTRIERPAYKAVWCNPEVVLLTLRTGYYAFSTKSARMHPLTGVERCGPSGDSDWQPFSAPYKLLTSLAASRHAYLAEVRGGDGDVSGVWKCDVADGSFSEVVRNSRAVSDWFAGGDLNTILGIGEIEGVRHAFLRSSVSGEWEPAGTLGPASEMCRVIAYDWREKLVHVYRDEGGSTALWTFDLKSRSWAASRVALPDDYLVWQAAPRVGDIDLNAPIVARGSGRLLGLRVFNAVPSTVWIDETFASHQAAIDAACPGQTDLVLETDETEGKLLVFSYSALEPGVFSIFDTTTGKLAAALRLQMPPPKCGIGAKPARFPLKDDTTLVGWITVVPHAQTAVPRRRLPLVVLFNSVPHQPWVGGYDDLASFLASRGYAVLQLNHRGTRGHGDAFFNQGTADLGANVPFDVAEAVAQCVSSKLVDASRVAVVGSGYGAHLALRTLVAKEGRFACGVAVSPVVDWGAIVRSSSAEVRAHWTKRTKVIGAKSDPAALTANSAVTFARDLEQPLLVIQGADDEVAPRGPVDRFTKRLQKAGAPVEPLKIKHASHGIPEQEPRAQMFEAIETFLARHLADPAGS